MAYAKAEIETINARANILENAIKCCELHHRVPFHHNVLADNHLHSSRHVFRKPDRKQACIVLKVYGNHLFVKQLMI